MLNSFDKLSKISSPFNNHLKFDMRRAAPAVKSQLLCLDISGKLCRNWLNDIETRFFEKDHVPFSMSEGLKPIEVDSRATQIHEFLMCGLLECVPEDASLTLLRGFQR